MKKFKKVLIVVLFFTLIYSCKKDNSTNPPSASCSSTCSSVQCIGITQIGARCQRMTTACCAKCWQHETQIIDERSKFLGDWYVVDNCNLSGQYSYYVTIANSSTNSFEVKINNFWGVFYNPAIATVNGNVISILRQEPDADDYFIQGSGTINSSNNTITWNYTVSDETSSQVVSDICTSTWTK